MSHAASYETYRAFMTPTQNSAVDLDDSEFFPQSHSGLLWCLSSSNVLRKSDTPNREIVSAALNLNPQLQCEEVTDWLRPNPIAEHGAISDELISIGYGIQMYAAFPTNSAAFNSLHEMPQWIAEVTRLITSCRITLPWQHTSRLVQRLQELLRDVTEEDEADSSISGASLGKFVEFIRENPNLSIPQLAVSPEGHIYARWKADRQKLFSVLFLPDGRVRFVVFKPNPKHKDVTVRFSGLTTSDALIDEIRNHQISGWVLEVPHER